MTEAQINLGQDFSSYKRDSGIHADPGGALEGLWHQEMQSKVRELETSYPGISQEFERLIESLPDPDDPKKSEFPFAASVVRVTNGQLEVLARATNVVNARKDSTGHAELVAITEAETKLGDKHLDGCTLLSVAQPCEMCSGAVRNTQIGTVVYGVSQEELRGRHVQFSQEFKPIRTVPKSLDPDALLAEAGIKVIGGYKHDEIIKKLTRTVGTTKEYYEDPDA